MQPPTVIPHLRVSMNTQWGEWSDCSKCGKVGKIIRKGICHVMQTEETNKFQTNYTAHETNTAQYKRKRGSTIHTTKVVNHLFVWNIILKYILFSAV